MAHYLRCVGPAQILTLFASEEQLAADVGDGDARVQ